MPGYKGHINGGLVSGGLLIVASLLTGYIVLHEFHLLGILGFCLLGALFPDIDTDSKGQNLFYAGLLVIDGVLLYHRQYQWAAWLGFFAMLPALGHHRGWTHTWWAMLIVPLPIVILPFLFLGENPPLVFYCYYGAFSVGYFSHLLLDRKFA